MIYGTLLAVVAAIFYYVRLFRVQRANPNMRPGMPGIPEMPGIPGMRRNPINWLGMLLLIVGAALSLVPALPANLRALWWLPVTLAFVLFSLGI